MASFARLDVLNTILKIGLVPVFYHRNTETAKQVIMACAKGGASVVEFTNRGDNAYRVFSDLVEYISVEMPELILGIGSVIDPGTAALYLASGANFVVGSIFNLEIAKICNRRKVAYIPGCTTPTEISTAEEAGVEIIKLFPGSHGGPNFVKSVLAPTPWSNIMPTGGVSPTRENLEGWFSAGAACVGMGSKLVRKDWILEGNYQAIEELTKATVNLIQDIRS